MSIEKVETKVIKEGKYKDFTFSVGNRGEGLRDYVDLKVSESARNKLPPGVKLPELHIELRTDSVLQLQSLSPIVKELINLNCKVCDGEGLLEMINDSLKELREDPNYKKPTGYFYEGL